MYASESFLQLALSDLRHVDVPQKGHFKGVYFLCIFAQGQTNSWSFPKNSVVSMMQSCRGSQTAVAFNGLVSLTRCKKADSAKVTKSQSSHKWTSGKWLTKLLRRSWKQRLLWYWMDSTRSRCCEADVCSRTWQRSSWARRCINR